MVPCLMILQTFNLTKMRPQMCVKTKSTFFIFLIALSVSVSTPARTWTLKNGKTFNSEYKRKFGNKIIFVNKKGEKRVVKRKLLSKKDIKYIELANPPRLDLDIRKKSSILQYHSRFDTTDLPHVTILQFGARIKKVSPGKYKYPLKLEMFVVAKQLHHNHKFILLDHQVFNIAFKNKKQKKIELWSPYIAHVQEYYIIRLSNNLKADMEKMASRGEKYKGYLLVVTDSRGKIIAKRTTSNWIFKSLKELRKRSIGNYIDETGARVYPGRPEKGKHNDGYHD